MSLFFSKRYSFKNGVQCHDCFHPPCFWVMSISFLSGWMSNARVHPPMRKILPMRFEPVRVKAYPPPPISKDLSDISSPLILKNPGSRSTPPLPRKEPGRTRRKQRKFLWQLTPKHARRQLCQLRRIGTVTGKDEKPLLLVCLSPSGRMFLI